MAKVLSHQSSSMYSERNRTGCMWGLLRFFEFYHRHHIHKRLAYRKHGGGKHTGGANSAKREQNFLPNKDDHDLLEGEEISLMDDKSKSSGKARLRFLFSKMSRKKDKKRKISPLASRLMRTASIHYLECNDYVLPDEMTSESETLTTELSSHEADCTANSEHVQPPPEGSDLSDFDAHCEACGTSNTIGYNDLDRFGDDKEAILIEKLNEEAENVKELLRNISLPHAKELSDILKLLNANGDFTMEFLEDPTYMLANYLHGLHSSRAEAVLTKSGSFPGLGFAGRKARGLSKLHDNGKENNDRSRAVPSIAGAPLNNLKPQPKVFGKSRSSSSLEVLTRSANETKFFSSRFKDLKERVKVIIDGNKKEHHRISLDGLLHKLPYGQKVSEEAKKEKLRSVPAFDRHDISCTLSRFSSDGSVFTNVKFADKSIQRSRSLTESLDRYSHLIELRSFRESKRRSERLKPVHEDGLQDRKHPKSFGRIFSNPEFVSFLPAVDLVSDVAIDTYPSDEPALLGAFVHKEDSTDLVTSVENTSGVMCGDTIDQDLEQPSSSSEHGPSRIYKAPDDFVADGSVHALIHDQEIVNEVDQYYNPIKPSPASLLDSFQEDPISPAKYSVSEAKPELKTTHEDSEDLNSVANPQKQSDPDGSDRRETVEADSSIVQMPMELTDSNTFHMHVDEKHKAKFNYVRDVLKKCGLFNEVFHGNCWSPTLPVDPVLFGESEGSPCDIDTEIDEPDMSQGHQLLFDLINEVILEIYEDSFSSYSGLSRYSNSRVRPFPAGHHVLEEVWSKISWHLSSQKQQDLTLEDIVARDFARNDGWLNLRWHTEFVGLELEALILDELLDEVLLQCAELTSP